MLLKGVEVPAHGPSEGRKYRVEGRMNAARKMRAMDMKVTSII